MALIKIAGIDPSLRNTGYGILNYDEDKEELWPSFCGVIRTPVKITGKDAILFMIEEIHKLSNHPEIQDCANFVIESPAAIYYSGMSSGGLIPVAHIAGACASIFCIKESKFDSSRITIVRPGEWNKQKKKDKTQAELVSLFGSLDDWHYHSRPKSHGKIKSKS